MLSRKTGSAILTTLAFLMGVLFSLGAIAAVISGLFWSRLLVDPRPSLESFLIQAGLLGAIACVSVLSGVLLLRGKTNRGRQLWVSTLVLLVLAAAATWMKSRRPVPEWNDLLEILTLLAVVVVSVVVLIATRKPRELAAESGAIRHFPS